MKQKVIEHDIITPTGKKEYFTNFKKSGNKKPEISHRISLIRF